MKIDKKFRQPIVYLLIALILTGLGAGMKYYGYPKLWVNIVAGVACFGWAVGFAILFARLMPKQTVSQKK